MPCRNARIPLTASALFGMGLSQERRDIFSSADTCGFLGCSCSTPWGGFVQTEVPDHIHGYLTPNPAFPALNPPEQRDLLTSDAHGRLPALGGAQVASGHALAPVILRAVEILHLLPRHVDGNLPDLQP